MITTIKIMNIHHLQKFLVSLFSSVPQAVVTSCPPPLQRLFSCPGLLSLRPSQWPLKFSSPASPQSAFSHLCSLLFPLFRSSSIMAAIVTHSRSSIICTLTMFLLNKLGLFYFYFFIFKMLPHCLWVEYMAFWAFIVLWSFIDFSLFLAPKMPVPIWLCVFGWVLSLPEMSFLLFSASWTCYYSSGTHTGYCVCNAFGNWALPALSDYSMS